MGPSAGPAQTMSEKPAMAFPRSTGPQRSAMTPGALLSGADTKVPVRNLPTSSPPKLGAKAQRKFEAA